MPGITTSTSRRSDRASSSSRKSSACSPPRGFHGPYTMELERAGADEPESVYVNAVAESVAYLRRIGAMI